MREHARICLIAQLIFSILLGSYVQAGAGVRRLPPRSSRSATPSNQSPESTLSRIRVNLDLHRRLLAQARRQEVVVLGELSGAEERLERAEVRLRQTTVALTGTRHAVAQATDALQAVTHRLSAHEGMMRARLRAFYEHGPVGYLDIVLGAADFQDLVARTYYMSLIMNQDARLFHEVSAERAQQAEVRGALTQREGRLVEQQQRWIVSRQETAQLAVERRHLLDRVRHERAAQEEAVRELEQESVRITEIIRARMEAGTAGPVHTLRNGILRWPVLGRISSGFGWRIHPIFRTREFHTGIDIAAAWGTPVRAAADGIVLFTGWMRGYGMLVILDHRGGWSTTYSHLSSYGVQIGEHVQQGQVIGQIGSTGWSTGPHLFFEVRQNGRPVDPFGS
jgi:murein DD-endopeptidase MepM/ murein hydrolase activator NlpD